MPCKHCNTYICHKTKSVTNPFRCEELTTKVAIDTVKKIKEI